MTVTPAKQGSFTHSCSGRPERLCSTDQLNPLQFSVFKTLHYSFLVQSWTEENHLLQIKEESFFVFPCLMSTDPEDTAPNRFQKHTGTCSFSAQWEAFPVRHINSLMEHAAGLWLGLVRKLVQLSCYRSRQVLSKTVFEELLLFWLLLLPYQTASPWQWEDAVKDFDHPYQELGTQFIEGFLPAANVNWKPRLQHKRRNAKS